jgi:hypothetical protein
MNIKKLRMMPLACGLFTGLLAGVIGLLTTGAATQAIWTPVTTRIISSGNYTVAASDSVIICTASSQQIITLNLQLTGKMVTVIEKNPTGSVVITNTINMTFTVPGIGTNQTPYGVQLGAWNTPTNEWTGVFDGSNW